MFSTKAALALPSATSGQPKEYDVVFCGGGRHFSEGNKCFEDHLRSCMPEYLTTPLTKPSFCLQVLMDFNEIHALRIRCQFIYWQKMKTKNTKIVTYEELTNVDRIVNKINYRFR